MNKKSEPVVLDAVPDADGVYRVPRIVERVEWKANYYYPEFDEVFYSNEAVRKRIHDAITEMNRYLFRYWSS